MSSSVNTIFLVGNLGNDPDGNTTGSGKSVVNFSLATSVGSGESEKTEWHRVVCWEKLADTAKQYLKKGSKVCVQGRLTYRQWDDKEGVNRTTAEVVANQITFLSPKPELPPEPKKRTKRPDPDTEDMFA